MNDARRQRPRDLGLRFGALPTGSLNAITDVPGVRVGHVTRIEGDSVRTGVTAIVPAEGNLFQRKVPAAVYVATATASSPAARRCRSWGSWRRRSS